MGFAGNVYRMGKKRNSYKILVGNPQGKILLGRPSRRWGDNKVDVTGLVCEGMDWINVARDKEIEFSDHGNKPTGYTKGREFPD
jgi:hypothetical protein